jgi:hypothetical protein
MPVFRRRYIKSHKTATKDRRKKELILYRARLCSRRKGKERKGKVDSKGRKSGQRSLVGMVVIVTFLRVR